MVGLSVGLAIGLAGGLAFGLAVRLTAGLTFALVDLWTVPLPRAATTTPDTTYRMDRRTNTVVGLSIGLTFGLSIALTVGLASGLTVGLASGLTVGLASGLTVGLAGSSARMVGLTQLILLITGAARVNFIRVLEGAHHRQVLRQAGAVYQFRHAELQEHLAKIHHQRTRSPTSK